MRAPGEILPWVFPLIFVGVWVGAAALISRCGWRAFAERFPAGPRPDSRCYTCPQAFFGRFGPNYNRVLRVRFCEAGVYIDASPLFRFFHPPFFLPWDRVRVLEPRKRLAVFDGYYLEAEEGEASVSIWLKKAAYEAALPHLPRLHRRTG